MKGSLLPLASGGFQSNPTHSFLEINQSKRPVKGPFSAPFAALLLPISFVLVLLLKSKWNLFKNLCFIFIQVRIILEFIYAGRFFLIKGGRSAAFFILIGVVKTFLSFLFFFVIRFCGILH